MSIFFSAVNSIETKFLKIHDEYFSFLSVDVNDKQSKRKQEAEDAEMVEEVANTEVRAKSEKDEQEKEYESCLP